MKTIDKDEFYRNLGDFLKSKGIELKEGSYAQRIRQGCNLLADAINATQKTVKRTKAEVDKKLDQLRQSIHEATAPKPPPASPPPQQASTGEAASAKANAKRRAKPSNRPAQGRRPKSGAS
jgi:hypothetical protein